MRGKQAPKRKLKPDTRYNSALVAKFINYLMQDGKKSTAQRVVYGCFDHLEAMIDSGKVDKNEYPNALAIFDQAVKWSY